MPRPVLNNTNVGFFGKLPSTGDFVARGLLQGVRPFLDQWLTRELAARSDTAETWPKCGIRAVIKWKKQWLVLLVLPSTDKSGRKFPFSICRIAAFAPDQNSADDWCGSVLDLAQAAIAKPLLADVIIAALAQTKETDLTPNTKALGDVIWHAESKLIPLSSAGYAQALDGLFQSIS